MNLIFDVQETAPTLSSTWFEPSPVLPDQLVCRQYPLRRWMRNNAWPWAGELVVMSTQGEIRYQVMHVENHHTVSLAAEIRPVSYVDRVSLGITL